MGEQSQLVRPPDGRAPVVDAELGVDVLGVRANRSERDREFAGDGWPVQLRSEVAQDLELANAEWLDDVA